MSRTAKHIRNDDKDAIAVVNGASRGIGLHIVDRLLRRTQAKHVFAMSRSVEDSPGLAALAGEFGNRLVKVQVDCENEESIRNAAEQVASLSQKRVDWLYNTAGTLHNDRVPNAPERRLGAIDAEWAVRSFRVNALGHILFLKEFQPLLAVPQKERDLRPPSVAASVSARVGSIEDNRIGGWYSYRATKAALNQFMRCASIELQRHRICCVVLHPGTVDTELSMPFQRNVAAHKLFSAERAAAQLVNVVDSCSMENSGSFYAWDGEEIPW